MNLNSWPSWFYFLHHHSWFMWCYGFNSGLLACYTSIVLIELCLQTLQHAFIFFSLNCVFTINDYLWKLCETEEHWLGRQLSDEVIDSCVWDPGHHPQLWKTNKQINKCCRILLVICSYPTAYPRPTTFIYLKIIECEFFFSDIALGCGELMACEILGLQEV